MKRHFNVLLLVLFFGTSCNVVGEAGNCEDNETKYHEVLEDSETEPGRRGWGNFTGQCGDEEEN